MISTRYLPPIGVLVGLALVPTIIHSYSSDVYDDGRSTAMIPATLAGFSSTATNRQSTWGKRRFDSDDWMERKYTSDKGSVILTVVRSYDPKSVYHHPELAVSYHREAFEGVEVKRFSEHPEVPVHVLRPSSSAPVLGMYVLHYGSGFVEDPMSFQLRSALQLLFSKRQPMTLFFVVDNDRTGMGDAESSAASRVLFDAINAFIQ